MRDAKEQPRTIEVTGHVFLCWRTVKLPYFLQNRDLWLLNSLEQNIQWTHNWNTWKLYSRAWSLLDDTSSLKGEDLGRGRTTPGGWGMVVTCHTAPAHVMDLVPQGRWAQNWYSTQSTSCSPHLVRSCLFHHIQERKLRDNQTEITRKVFRDEAFSTSAFWNKQANNWTSYFLLVSSALLFTILSLSSSLHAPSCYCCIPVSPALCFLSQASPEFQWKAYISTYLLLNAKFCLFRMKVFFHPYDLMQHTAVMTSSMVPHCWSCGARELGKTHREIHLAAFPAHAFVAFYPFSLSFFLFFLQGLLSEYCRFRGVLSSTEHRALQTFVQNLFGFVFSFFSNSKGKWLFGVPLKKDLKTAKWPMVNDQQCLCSQWAPVQSLLQQDKGTLIGSMQGILCYLPLKLAETS